MIHLIEQAVISLLLKSQEELDSFGLIEKEDFTDSTCGHIFKIIRSLVKKHQTVDISSVSDELAKIFKKDCFIEICDIARIPYNSDNVTFYAESILSTRKYRQLNELILNITSASQTNDNDFLLSLPEKIEKIVSKSSIKLSRFKDHLCNALELLHERMNSTGGLIGLSTGFYKIDELTQGFQGGQLIVLAARPGAGKSTLASNITEHVVFKNNKSAVFFSLEMSQAQIIDRITASQVSILSSDIKSGKISSDQYIQISDKYQQICDKNLSIENAETIDEVILKIKSAYSQKKVDMVVIDYIGLLLNGKHEHAYLVLGEISRKLKKLALKLNIPILLLSQMNRDIEKEKRQSRLSDLRQSGNLEQDADIVMFIEYKQGDEYAVLNIAKNRNGTPENIILKFEGKYNRFSNTDITYEQFENMKSNEFKSKGFGKKHDGYID